ncbi:TPA: hypothetical protein PPN70_000884 [Serratia rubidaea]|uniref:STM2901 family protein n=1 Tax=Serratia rubidaea TaxID=61652 RepID=UPI0023B1210D|nr:hypothetical protein [Serratia rubidaea]MDK1703843.1 hypothetical protein [Serratia rubidaea]HDJ1438477.1 hypothetical protein [Serratia rubidaea]HDJ1447659.1 hypothetical protein [Serratia rubidaea]HDJ1460716.1 hypothetical protein [Serratia rubidaea]HDJ2773112.1 hypothetical protein [Serratia rubidaea]
MDTVEELHGTYFYGGLHNLSASELYFWIFIDMTAEHFSGSSAAAHDLLAAFAIYSGRNTIPVSGKLADARPGTSRASVYFRKLLRGKKLPVPLPTLVGPPGLEVIMTKKLGTFVGRSVPVVGWTVVAADITYITLKTTARYNTIARGSDRLW